MPPKRKKSARKRRAPVPTRTRDGMSIVERLNAPLASGLVLTGRQSRGGKGRRAGPGRRAVTGGYTSVRTGTVPGQPTSLSQQQNLLELQQTQLLQQNQLKQQKLESDIAQKAEATKIKQREQALKEEESRFKRDLQAHKQRISDEEKIIKLQEQRAREQVRPMEDVLSLPSSSKAKGKAIATQTPPSVAPKVRSSGTQVTPAPGVSSATQTRSTATRSGGTQATPAPGVSSATQTRSTATRSGGTQATPAPGVSSATQTTPTPGVSVATQTDFRRRGIPFPIDQRGRVHRLEEADSSIRPYKKSRGGQEIPVGVQPKPSPLTEILDTGDTGYAIVPFQSDLTAVPQSNTPAENLALVNNVTSFARNPLKRTTPELPYRVEIRKPKSRIKRNRR